MTGFEEIELQGTGMVETYLDWIKRMEPQKTTLFLMASAEILDRTERKEEDLLQAIRTQLMPISAYNGMARKLITLWYLGNWCGQIVSPESYVAGLVWPTAETHPFGAKQPGFASWSEPPISVKS